MHRRSILLGAGAALTLASRGWAQVTVPRGWQAEWPRTDFTRSSIDFGEVLSGGVPRDGIPALDGADYIKATAVAGIGAREPVITVALAGQERAYPVRYLTWHEIVNDAMGGIPIAVTFCPLCNSALVFDRRVDAQTLSFGVTGKLRNSDLVMFDRESESWWQQFTGEAIIGAMQGTTLTQLVSWMEPFSAFAARNPDGEVMAEPRGGRRPYGRNPYGGYDSSPRPFLYDGEPPPHGIEPLSRVLRIGNRAWPLARLAELGEIEEAGVRIVWQAGMASALDSDQISEGRDIGHIRVYGPGGDDVLHEVVFAFAFHAFAPQGEWMLGN